MQGAWDRLSDSLDRIRNVTADIDTRLLTGTFAERERDETLRCACTVILSGFLETFLKECVAAFIRKVSARSIPFGSLPAMTQNRHFVQGGQLLGQVVRREGKVSWVGASYMDIVQRLASPADPSGEYELLWEAFAGTQSNPSLKVIKEILEYLGVKQPGKRLESYLAPGYSGLALRLASFMAVRHECAHTGTATKIPTSVEIRDYCDVISDISRGVVYVLTQSLKDAPFGTNINSADVTELQRLPGLGSTRAQAIISYRAVHGPLSDVNDLIHVPGFGKKLVESLELYVHV